MENFADQCLDMAQSILGHNLESITEQGAIAPFLGEEGRLAEPGHAALAILVVVGRLVVVVVVVAELSRAAYLRAPPA